MAIAHRSTGSATFDFNGFNPTLPAHVAGDMILLFVAGKPYNAGVTVTGWTEVGTGITNGTTAAGNDSGSMFVRLYYKEAASGAEADPLVDETGTNFNIVGGIGMVFQKGGSDIWDTPIMSGGGDTTSGTGFAYSTAAGMALAAGDAVICCGAMPSDAATPLSVALAPTLAGCTFTNTRDPATDPETTSGGDMGMSITRSTLTGSGSGVVSVAGTLAGAQTGTGIVVRLRVTVPIPVPTLNRWSTRRRAANRFLTIR